MSASKVRETRKIIVLDIDGTIAAAKPPGGSYGDVEVVPEVRSRLVELKSAGYWIILSTSRNMLTFEGNLGQILKHTAPVLMDWLKRHDIPFDEIHFGKPWCGHDGFYVDDRAIRPREFARLSLGEIAETLKRDTLA